MGYSNCRLSRKFITRTLFIMFVCLLTIQLALNLTMELAALQFLSRWVKVSGQLRVPSSRITDSAEPDTEVCHNSTTKNCLPLCPEFPPKLVGLIATYMDSPQYSDLERLFPWVSGGRGKPSYCHPRHRVAIIIPYRNRDSQLRTFLYNIHPFLYRQELDYGIYVVEQNGTSRFNRAMLMNIGYAEASKIYDYQCYIFHDVDLIPENDRNIYSCPKQPRHMSAAVDKFKYRLPYSTLFGGVSALTKEQFKKVNGFPNRYFGWGGEDDDMWNSRKQLKKWKNYTKTDGINNLHYEVLGIKYNHLFTRITVDINEDQVMKSLEQAL